MRLSNQREVPKEVMFKLTDATQDQIKKNRYWFDFPSQWADQLDKDPIIGIRSMYLTKTNRLINFNLYINIKDSEDDSHTVWKFWWGNMKFYLDGSDTIKEFTYKFNEQWYNKMSSNNPNTQLTFSSATYTLGEKDIWSHYDYDPDSHTCLLSIGTTGSLPESVTVTDTDNETHNCYIEISIEPLNRYTCILFGVEYHTAGAQIRIRGNRNASFPIWSRYQCYIKSSLADDDVNNFLGHTRKNNYYPIKYYRLKNKNKKCWIELYETRYHDVPVIIPRDSEDDLFIEAIVLFTSEGII